MASIKLWSNLFKPDQTHQNPLILEAWSWIDGFPHVRVFSASFYSNWATSVCVPNFPKKSLG